PNHLESCANLLSLCTEPPALSQKILLAATPVFVKALPSDPNQSISKGVITQALIVNTLTALERIDTALAQTVVKLFLAHPQLYSMDTLLVNVAIELCQSESTATAQLTNSFSILRNAAHQFLTQITSTPPTPPANQSRAIDITCDCADCSQLKQFLGDPDAVRVLTISA
ncbi:hypothetical protein TI04_13645, partial [Achromatium sp. WMS2]